MNQLICGKNQLTDIYMRVKLAPNGLSVIFKWLSLVFEQEQFQYYITYDLPNFPLGHLFLNFVSTRKVAALPATLNPLSANPTKWPNTLKQFVGKLPTNCLSVFGHFVNLALKGLTSSLLFASPLPLVFFLAFTVSNNLYTTGTNIEDHIIKFGR